MLQQHEAARRETFGYVCRACSRCCQHKAIQVNPCEIARLARRTEQSSARFRANCTMDGKGTVLRRDDGDTCMFLDLTGCTVHSDRPLVCRLYPLGRRVYPDGTEEWLRATPHPQSEGRYTNEGTIADFIAAQGALPYMRAADEYAEWVRKAYAHVEAEGGKAEAEVSPDLLVDMDAAIAGYCATRGEPAPTEIEERRMLHMKILYRQLDQGGNDA
jgi:uncharacterized protein